MSMLIRVFPELTDHFVCLVMNSLIYLTHCMLGNFSSFCCRLLTFFKINRNTIRVSNSFDPDRDQHSVCKGYQQPTKSVVPDLGPNSQQRTLAQSTILSSNINDSDLGEIKSHRVVNIYGVRLRALLSS